MAKPTREDMIERLVNLVDDWDLQTLIDSCKDHMTSVYEIMSSADIKDAYEFEFGLLEDDETLCDDDDRTPALCRCDIRSLMSFGHDLDCPERK